MLATESTQERYVRMTVVSWADRGGGGVDSGGGSIVSFHSFFYPHLITLTAYSIDFFGTRFTITAFRSSNETIPTGETSTNISWSECSTVSATKCCKYKYHHIRW